MEYNSRMSETTPLLNNNVLNNNGNKKQAGKGISQANQHALQKELEVLSQAAEQGGAMSQFILGMCYAEGKGVERNLKKAFELYSQAAEQGNAEAQYNLGVCYKNRDGVEQNLKEAIKWYKQAALQGVKVAKRNIINTMKNEYQDIVYEPSIFDILGNTAQKLSNDYKDADGNARDWEVCAEILQRDVIKEILTEQFKKSDPDQFRTFFFTRL